MSETINHTRLVSVILQWVDLQLTGIPGVCLYCDCPPVRVTEKPSPIDGFFPDICVLTVPAILTMIGEAKTLPDLESERSFRQIVAFLRFLTVQPSPCFVMATPWQALATAKNLVRRAKKDAAAEFVTTKFLTDLPRDAERS